MLSKIESDINAAFMQIYNSVHRVEERMLKHSTLDLSISELDMLETVGAYGEKGCTISDIARDNSVTLPTVTVAVKRLEAKGYVEKNRCKQDGRVVFVALTRLGKKADAAHKYFHERMVRSFIKDVSQEEREMLLRALKNLESFLKHAEGSM
ncbi:MAG: MarR family winged helix-turn-helix transcriptional regulator [Christensenellales bacterium]|jgi:DNA-binding MarR family transcriptional regulator